MMLIADGASCESTMLVEAVINFITKGFTDMKQFLGSRQQTRGAVDSSSLCEYKTHSLFIRVCLCAWKGVSECLNASR